MKKKIVSIMVLAMTFGAMAQSVSMDSPQMKEWRQLKQQRNIAGQAAKSNRQQTTATYGAKQAQALPEDRVWFPGEWEEVQAIVVTPYYSYMPDSNLGSGMFMADPLVTGYADYYKYNATRGWQNMGITGPYKAIMDTNSTFGNTFFYLMDGIQQGHAQAWVHVETADDTAKVLRTLRRKNLRSENVRFVVGPGNSFWYRDCGPICFYYGDQDSVAMMDFQYYPGRALDDSLPSLIYRQMHLPNYITTLEWEGGNCLVDGAGFLFTSDAVYNGNGDAYGQLVWDGVNPGTINYSTKPRLTQAQTREAFRSLLGQRETHILPAYQYDGGTGHIDLYADMYEENGFVFSIMPDHYSSWVDYRTGARNIDSLCSYTSIFDRPYYKSEIPFPSTDNGGYFSSQSVYNSQYTRTYSNHTFVNDLILQPVFSQVINGQPTADWDKANLAQVQAAYPGYTIYPVDVREFDGSGGAIHCITKQIPADNPIRILHKSIVGSANDMSGRNIPVSAIITNRSGIANAECTYRINGGEWQTVSLNGNGNKFSGVIPAIDYTDYAGELDTIGIVSVEYYISATSNNGKTITKPMTAHQGGYYSFYMDGTEETIDSTKYDFGTEPRPMTDITFVFDANRTTLDDSTDPEHHDPVAIEQVAESNFGQFYPNPASEKANININLGNGGNYHVTIVDNMGRTVHTTTLQTAGSINFSIRTDSLASGVYSVIFSTNGHQVVRRLVVK